ncbi:MAG: hypothetical protein ABL958_07635, partial [Bdellovibrionia bacterium]
MNDRELKMSSGGTEQVLKLSQLGGQKESQSLARLIAWLELDAEKISQRYNVFESGKSGLRFKPKDAAMDPFSDLELTLDGSGFLTGLKINERSGDRLEIDFGRPVISRSDQ